MGKFFKKLTRLQFEVYGRQLLSKLISKSHLNFLTDQELLPEFYQYVSATDEFKNFANFKLKITPKAAAELLSELRVLPNDKRIIHMFKQWRDNVDNREKVRQARSQVIAGFKKYISEG